MTMRIGEPPGRLLLGAILFVVLIGVGVLSGSASAQTSPGLLRTPESATVAAGEVFTVTLTPTGFTGAFAVRELLGNLELVDHNADNLADGTFIMLQPRALTYQVRSPVGTPTGTKFEISGQWWVDPSDKLPIDPAVITITVAGSTSSTPTVSRSPAIIEAAAGDVVTISVTPSEVAAFYAVKEDLGGLELLDSTADNLADGTFVMLEAEPFEYTLKVPLNSYRGQQYVVTGTWWTELSNPQPVYPSQSVVKVIGVRDCADQNNDGHVSVIDVTINLQFLAGLVNPTTEQETRGDANADDKFNILDVVAMLQDIVGLKPLPVRCSA